MNVTCPECRSVFRVDPSKLPAASVRARCAVCGGLITVVPSSSVRDEFAPRSHSERVPAAFPAGGAQPAFSRPDARGPSAAPALPPAAPAQSTAPVAAPPTAPSHAPPVSAPRPDPQAAPRPGASPTREAAPPNLGAATAAALFGRVDAPPAGAAPGGPPRAPAGPPPRVPSPARAAMPFVRPSAGGTSPQPGAAAPSPFAARVTPPGSQNAPRRPINPFLANDPNAKARRLARALISDMITYFPEKREEGLRTGALKQMFEEEITKSYGEYVEQVGREFAESTPHFQDALNEILAGGRKLF